MDHSNINSTGSNPEKARQIGHNRATALHILGPSKALGKDSEVNATKTTGISSFNDSSFANNSLLTIPQKPGLVNSNLIDGNDYHSPIVIKREQRMLQQPK
jgi:hypothetical protein